jgi:hypothetical protein
MSLDLELGRKPRQIEMPPLPPEPQEAAPVEQESQNAIIAQEQASGSNQEGQDGQGTQPQETTSQEKQEVEASGQNGPRESVQARNFRELREKEARTARERDDLAQQIKDLKSQLSHKDDFNLNPDDLVEGKHLAKVVKELQEQKELIRAYDQQRQFAEAEIKAASRYSDFRNVVTPQTIDALQKADPRRAEALKRMAAQDQEEALIMAYMSIKDMNLAPHASDRVAPSRTEQLEAQKAQQNAAKPRPLNTVSAQHSDSPISRMNAFSQGELTPEMQKQHLKEMNEARKGY